MTALQEVVMSPKIENAPGLTWRQNKYGWEARWRARADLVRRGFRPRVYRLWASDKDEVEPDQFAIAFIQDRCNALQSEMLVWGRGGLPAEEIFDGTIASLAKCYQTDPDSSYQKARYNTRRYYDTLCRMVVRDIGGKRVSEITARDLLRWHGQYHERIAMGHSLVGMVRTLATFGATLLGRRECRDLKEMLGDMRFTMPKPRQVHLTAEMATAIRREAHKAGKPQIALAQALQFELTLRQKDVIGEWVPISEPGPLSSVIDGNMKWIRGLDWREVDQNWILKHVTSKRQKEITVDLKLAPMVGGELVLSERGRYPASGPIIIGEKGVPYTSQAFRKMWRKIADSAGVPKDIRNMDTRAGAISEATDAGAPLEKVRKAATHSDIGMTQKYSRGDAEATAEVMQIRAAHRKTKGESDSTQ